MNLVEKYRQREYCEDLEYLEHDLRGNTLRLTLELGLVGLQEGLKSNFESGLTPVDFQDRDEHFGSNYKAPPKRTPFCKLFIGALDDFMLKLLLVCACISISIDVGFAESHERSHCTFISFPSK